MKEGKFHKYFISSYNLMGVMNMNKVFNVLKRVLLGLFLLFAYNFFAVEFNLIVPINLITILFVSLFDIPALFSLVFMYVLVF